MTNKVAAAILKVFSTDHSDPLRLSKRGQNYTHEVKIIFMEGGILEQQGNYPLLEKQ